MSESLPIKDFKTSPKEFRERARKLKNIYDEELKEYRDQLYKDGKRFGNDRYSYNTITIGMFEEEKGITYKDGEYFEYRMEYAPIINGFSNGYGDYAGLNEGLVGGIFLQRTGLYDKNGVKIREGDILRYIQSYTDKKSGIVCKDGYVQKVVKRADYGFNVKAPKSSVVAGNIFENSDLLTETQPGKNK